MECKWKFGNLFAAGFKLTPKKNFAHGSVERWVHERQTMLGTWDSRHQLFPQVLLQRGLSLLTSAVWPNILSPSHHLMCQTQPMGRLLGSWICPTVSEGDGGHPLCPACEMQGTHWGNPTVVPSHSLPRRDAHATVPPSCPKQGTACSQPLETITYTQKETEAQPVPLCHSPFLNPLASTFKILLWSIPKARAVLSMPVWLALTTKHCFHSLINVSPWVGFHCTPTRKRWQRNNLLSFKLFNRNNHVPLGFTGNVKAS